MLEVADDVKRTVIRRCPPWARHCLMMGYRGSHAHGTYIAPTEKHGTDDVDVFSVVLQPRTYYVGLGGYTNHNDSFESGGEDVDISCYDLRKYVHLLIKGNPNVHSWLWLRPEHYFLLSPAAEYLIANRTAFMSRAMLYAFGGYAIGQLRRMQAGSKQGYMGAKREGLMAEYGYDIKNASHCLRLLLTGIHLARTGQLLVFLGGEMRSQVLAVKSGEVSLADVTAQSERLFAEFESAKDACTVLPKEVDWANCDGILRTAMSIGWGDGRL